MIVMKMIDYPNRCLSLAFRWILNTMLGSGFGFWNVRAEET